MAMAMVMSTAVFIYAEDEAPAGTDPVVTDEESAEAPVVKADQVIKVAAEKKVVAGRASKLGAKLTAGDGALTYATSDKSVVTVDKAGGIKAKAVGSAVVTVTAAETEGYNAASAEVAVTVVPKAITITSLVCKKHGKFTVKWKKLKKVSGFEVQFCKKPSFKKGTKVKAVKSGKAAGATVSKLKKKAKYYVRIRVYKTVDGVRYYSDWSKAKAVKIK
jgi:hypothetical protein